MYKVHKRDQIYILVDDIIAIANQIKFKDQTTDDIRADLEIIADTCNTARSQLKEIIELAQTIKPLDPLTAD